MVFPQIPKQGNILIVDDNPHNLRLLSTMLTEQGYKVRKAINGKQALKAVFAAPPDLILLDVNMPVLNGYQVCEQLKSSELTEDIPVIFISAIDNILDKVKAFEVGGVDYVTKPFELQELVVRIENQLKLSHAQKLLEEQNHRLQEEIIAREQAEAALRQNEGYLRLILDNIPQQVFWKDTNSVFLGCNKNWAESAYLKSPSEVIGKTDFDLLPDPKIAELFRQQDQEIMEKDTPVLHVVAQKQRPAPDGSVVWLDINKIPIHNAEGQVIGILGVLEDITQRKLAEDALLAEQAKSEALLLNILPKSIAEQLKQDIEAITRGETKPLIAEQFDEVSILFADIVGFTPLATQLSATELINLLNQIFSIFDRLSEQHGVEKIKTIGDAYMVAAGLPIPRADHAAAIANMALDMQDQITEFQEQGHQFQLRIGIHTGPVVAGVIGMTKFIYDLWGDTVNVASRMESHGEPGRIQVTAKTYHQLKDKFYLKPRGFCDIKGKGKMITYWLQNRL